MRFCPSIVLDVPVVVVAVVFLRLARLEGEMHQRIAAERDRGLLAVGDDLRGAQGLGGLAQEGKLLPVKAGRLAHLMPDLQRVAAGFVDRTREQRALACPWRDQAHLHVALILAAEIPEDALERAVLAADDDALRVAMDALALKVIEEGEGVHRGLGDQAVGDHAEAAVERTIRHVALLKHIAERPVGVARGDVAQAREQTGDVAGVEVRVVDGAEGIVGGVELGDVHLHALILGEAVDDLARLAHFLDGEFRRAHLVIEIAADAVGLLAHVGMAGDEIEGQLLFAAEGQEIAHPLLRAVAAADRRAADAHTGQRLLDGSGGDFIQAQVLRLVCILPEAGEVRLVPDLAGPCAHLVGAVALGEMRERRLDHRRPFLLVGGRGGVALPVEDGLLAGGHLLGHETQLEEGLDAQLKIAVHHAVEIGEAVGLVGHAVRVGVRAVDAHIVAEETVAADVLEMRQILRHGELVEVFLVQGEAHAARADAEGGVVDKGSAAALIDGDVKLLHDLIPP